MESEKIQLKTETGQLVEADVLSKHADRIDVVIAQSVRCSLVPTRNGLAYVGTVRGREVTYERTRKSVEAELAKRDQNRRRFR
ncbi:MAG TPA: hypothetical protein VMR31_03815 [Myxococcota bacterium]|nr:hypothetical protein [Myxococcota bacterium]